MGEKMGHFSARVFTSIVVACALASAASGVTTIDTRPVNSESVTDRDWGQTFTVPSGADHFITQFQFFARAIDPTNFQALLYPFDAATSKISGPAIYQSEIRQIQGSVLTTQTYNTGLTPLQPGAFVLAVLRQKGLGNTTPYQMLQVTTDVAFAAGFTEYPGGEYRWHDQAYPYTNTVWNVNGGDSMDVGFTATFDAPEPAMLSSLALGALMLLRQKRAVAR
jgi:hypothetical protein